jgi:undecaprenyl phosphate-alpha-L-ara4FN deformylase
VQICLKVDVDTFRGTRDGVPALVKLLQQFDAQATFFFSLGPDYTGRAIRRVFRPGFLKKAVRTSVSTHYGWKTLCYGTLLPGPDIGRKCADIMRATRDAGFEVGIHCWDHVGWQDYVARRGADWARRQLEFAIARFEEIFDDPARTSGAPGWQVTPHSLRLQQELGLLYCSDTRGTHPFLPVMGGVCYRCPQLPTTLPTLDELVGVNGMDGTAAAGRLLQLSDRPLPNGHVFTLHAELEGGRFLPVFERLLRMWRERGIDLVSLGGLYRTLDCSRLPAHRVVMGEFPGRSGTLALQAESNGSPGAVLSAF